jgi:hypothetical protein
MITFNLHPYYYVETGEDGPYTALAVCIACECDGYRYIYCKSYRGEEQAWEMMDTMQRHVEKNATWRPRDTYWVNDGAVYGGSKWGKDDEHRNQRLDVEAEYGPGSYNHSHPGYLR